ncbi:class I SAM-dependent methyltransferase [Brucella sp. 2716]|uniref:class I SAM-dependent methyltransferase n=1 Tax=Brucella sp. 2716 TaxID=2975052 RepID=UPI00217D2663|nr:class I SAM-dependent methyltransferase [Brucella sp. 2716]UWF59416.1 class I SAM-dependent methyltransferase [Brucella sp. 2716]
MSEERLSLVYPDWPEFLFHVQRYALARRFLSGKRVLDCACGEGYGSAYMATIATHVTGVDVATSAIEVCRARYENQENLSFTVGDICSLPFPDASFDVVCCFETIEHLDKSNSEVALNELVRVLAPHGTLLISTPDGEVGRRRKYANPYHLHEMSSREFEDILRERFRRVSIFTQELNFGSVLFPFNQEYFDDTSGAIIDQAKLNADLSISPQFSNKDYYYLFAVCSNSHVSIPASHAFFSFGREPILSLWNKLDESLKENRTLSERVRISESSNKLLSHRIIEDSKLIDELQLEHSELVSKISYSESNNGILSHRIIEDSKLIDELQLERSELISKLSYMEPFWRSRSARAIRKYFYIYNIPIIGPILSTFRKSVGVLFRFIYK